MINNGARASIWVALSRDPQKLAQLTGKLDKEASPAYNADQWLELKTEDGTRVWTDDYASVLPHLSFWKNK